MTTRQWILLSLLLALLAVVAATLCSWFVVSYKTFPNRILPGETYTIDDRTYKIPDLPHKTWKSDQPPSKSTPVPMLSKDMLRDLRLLVRDAIEALRKAQVSFWASGGTLISAMVWKSLMCYDDDCDVHVHWDDREYIWSPEFARIVDSFGMEVFFLRGASLKVATREMASARLRRKGTDLPTLDIFFVKENDAGKPNKVNAWLNDKIKYNKKEVWDSWDWIFPLRFVEVDGVEFPVPNQAERVLTAQYGDEWSKYIKSPKPLVQSHKWAFWFSNMMNAWTVRTPAAEQDLSKLVNPRGRSADRFAVSPEEPVSEETLEE